MLILRKFVSLLSGKVTPFQIVAACLLGTMLGFAPSFGQAPGLVLGLFMLLLVLNANLFLAFFAAAGMKLVSFLLLPVSFASGRLLLDGPTQPLFEKLINAPVFAFFGFEYYTVTGAIAASCAEVISEKFIGQALLLRMICK